MMFKLFKKERELVNCVKWSGDNIDDVIRLTHGEGIRIEICPQFFRVMDGKFDTEYNIKYHITVLSDLPREKETELKVGDWLVSMQKGLVVMDDHEMKVILAET